MMQYAALTFRAEPDFIEAIRKYADDLGVSANVAMRQIIAPVIGLAKRLHTNPAPRNDLGRFCGALKDVDWSEMDKSQKQFATIDEEMWK